MDVQWWQSAEYQSYFNVLDKSGGFYKYRWGDACTHFMAVAAMLDKEVDTLQFRHVPYWHQGTVVMPEWPGLFQTPPREPPKRVENPGIDLADLYNVMHQGQPRHEPPAPPRASSASVASSEA